MVYVFLANFKRSKKPLPVLAGTFVVPACLLKLGSSVCASGFQRILVFEESKRVFALSL